ncbi:hypothetical protein DH2020_029263 [Rehmannia glutinosa]|uniref:Reverse transcriptase Ty1/copia-type domain-containing protein n=1 Tax=Rehmannia glutinosa TaxID=99300 RepID=A0ABR0VP22_REHGL
MAKPHAFEKNGCNLVCKLNKALYGLKQAPRAWYFKLKQVLQRLGFIFSHANNSLFFRKPSDSYILILVCVDDILITSSHDTEVDKIVKLLDVSFSIKDLGPIHQFLGIEVKQCNGGLHLCQHHYVKELLAKVNMSDAKGSVTPMVSSPHLSKSSGNSITDATLYGSVIGGLQYITITRSNIVYSVNKLSQYMQHSLDSHWKTVKRVLRYLATTPTFSLSFVPSPNLHITGFSDSDWATNIDDRKFITGFCVYLGDNIVSWCSKKQAFVSRSSTEAEYCSLANCATELLWMKQTLADYKCSFENVPIFCDNISAINIAQNPVHHNRTKHIEIRHHFLRDCVSKRKIEISFVPSQDQLADIFTKPLTSETFASIRARLGIMHIE